MVKIKNKSSFIFLIIAMIFITSMIFARDVFSISINKWMFVGLCACFAVVLPYCELVYLLCFIVPLLSGLPGNYILPLIMLFLFTKRGFVISNSAKTYYVLIMIFELCHYVFYSFPISFPNVIGYLSILFLTIHIISSTNKELDSLKCSLLFCCGLLVFSIAIVFITRANGDISMLIESGDRIGVTKSFL